MNGFDNMLEKETKKRFKLKGQYEEEFTYQPVKRQFIFYQICSFELNGKHQVRKVVFNENSEIIPSLTKESKVKKEKINKFLETCPEYKRAIYPTYNLDTVGYPSDLEILTAQSLILNDYIE
jgi:hypothetical protein